MSAAALVAIVIAAGEARSPMTQALLAAATEALGGHLQVAAFEAAPPSDGEALRLEASASTLASAQVIFHDPLRTRATIRLHVVRLDRWVDRSIAFAAEDSLIERGRTLGFAIGSMLPEADPTLQLPAPEPPRSPAPAPPPGPLGPSAGKRRAVGLSMIGGDDFQGVAPGLGGSLDVALPASERIALRLSAGLRAGAMASVPATTSFNASAGVGVALAPWPVQADRRLGLALRADALLILQAVRHTRGGGASEWKTTPLPGADALVEIGWRLAGDLHAVVAAGLEAAFGTVDVSVVSSVRSQTATIPALRAVGQAGLRLYF